MNRGSQSPVRAAARPAIDDGSIDHPRPAASSDSPSPAEQAPVDSLHATPPTIALTLPGGLNRSVSWGHPWQYLSAAYWVERTREWGKRRPSTDRPHRLGTNFREEVIACLLGGHGITYELNIAAYHAVRAAGCLDDSSRAAAAEVIHVLSQPLVVGDRRIHYRFPNQKGARVADALARLRTEMTPPDPLDARAWLLGFGGIGPKTASWIVRNHYGTDDVAIIDIHIWRAGIRANIFDEDWTPNRNYWVMESAFLQWARFGDVKAADLDAVMWVEQASAVRRGPRVTHTQDPLSGL